MGREGRSWVRGPGWEGRLRGPRQCLLRVRRESKSSALVKGLECSTECYCSRCQPWPTLLMGSILVSSAGQTKAGALLFYTVLHPAPGRMVPLFLQGFLSHLHFLGKTVERYQSPRRTLERGYVWNLIKCPSKWDWSPFYWKHHFDTLKAIKIQIIRIHVS